MPNWRNEYRRCDNCRREYRPQREAQSYCNPNCRRVVRGHFVSRTVGAGLIVGGWLLMLPTSAVGHVQTVAGAVTVSANVWLISAIF